MSILIKNPGILTTVQDLGRFGYQKLGINPSGAMDPTAARLINILVGNDENEAVLEMHYPAPRLFFKSDAILAVGGGNFAPTVDGIAIDNWQPFHITKGSQLAFAARRSGSRSYLTVRGGFAIHDWLGSKSTNLAAKLGGFHGRKLQTWDEIRLSSKTVLPISSTNFKISDSIVPAYRNCPTIRVIAGAEFELLTKASRRVFLNGDFAVSVNSDRMGFRLVGQSITLSKPIEIISSAVSAGTVQLLPNGQLIILMADHQTTGGYPRVAHVISTDRPLVAQLGTNDKISFEMIDLKEAELLAIEFENSLSFLRAGCKLQTNY